MGLLVMGCNHDLGIYVGGYDGYFLLLSNMSWICSIMIYMYIYITRSVYLEYGIEILASQGIPIIELENIYLEYS
jgi:hypothetical protein